MVLRPYSAHLASLRVPVLLPMLAWQAWLLFIVCLYTFRCSLFSECSAGLMCSRHYGVCCRRMECVAGATLCWQRECMGTCILLCVGTITSSCVV